MNGGTIDIRLRPVKLAFLIEPTDKKAIFEAIQINSFLWGGIYNPIIPVFSRAPKVWRKGDPISRYKGKEILAGYLEAFNPDYVVPIGRCAKKKLDFGNREAIAPSEIFSKIDEDGTPQYGVGLFEILRDFHSKELKYKRRKPIEFYLLKLPRQDKLFFASVFGSLPTKINKIIDKHWAEELEAKKQGVDFSNYGDYLKPGKLFVRRMLYRDIEARSRGGIRGGDCLFFMDAKNPHDIIDYWNLRALGWIVVPVAQQAVSFDATKQLAKSFVEEHSGISRWNKDYYINATIMRGRSVDEKAVMDFMKNLDIAKDERAKGSRWSFQHWYPRLWDEWARDKDGAVCAEIEAASNEIDFNSCQESVSVRTVDPSFVARFGGHGTSRFANVIDVRTYCNDDIYAEVIPDSGKELTRVLSGIGLREWRFTRRESVFLSQHANWRIHIPIPKAEDAFRAWLKDNSFESELSPSGRIAKQMIKRLGGLWGLQTIANEELIALLRDMESGKEIEKDAFWGRISKVANTKFFKSEPAKLLKHYMDTDMFRLGATIQCPVCSHRSWYAIDNLDYKLQCTNCLDNFGLPSHSPDDIKWSYRTFGPFSLTGAAEGAYSTLLTLRFFSKVLDAATTPLMSFLTKIDGAEREIDLGLFLKESRFNNEEEVRVIFAECKTYKQFEKRDVDKLAKLAARFPGSAIIFATLRDSLTSKEKKLLKPLINRCRRYWKAEQPYNPILILTKTELFADLSVEYAWRDASDEKYKKFSERHYYSDKLLHICDATQQLYMDMRPWQDEIREKFERRRQLRKAQNLQNPQTT